MIRVIMSFPDLATREYTLEDGDVLTIGRNFENDIVIDDPTVCLRPAYIALVGDELILWNIENGDTVILNGRAVQSAKLRDGDSVQLGRYYRLTVSEADMTPQRSLHERAR